MEDKSKKLYLELQMDELKAALGIEVEEVSQESSAKIAKLKDSNARNNKNADVAKLYEDAAEYEKELESFEKELEIVNSCKLGDLTCELATKLPDGDRDYAKELKAILLAAWRHFVEVDKTHPVEQLELMSNTEVTDFVNQLCLAYPESNEDFEKSLKEILIKRLETLIAIKKEHIEEEIEEIYIAGLKPSFVKRIYKEFHGIS